jgi:hypothetical protein
MRSAPCQTNKAITPNKKSLPKGCSAKAVARANDMRLGETPIPVGAASPVISTSAGPASAASMPPAPNSSQNTGAIDRFMASIPLRTG